MAPGTAAMIHLSGTFAYQPPAEIEVTGPRGSRLPAEQPQAFFVCITLRNDDGSPVYPEFEPVDVTASVVLSKPQFYPSLGGYLELTFSEFVNEYGFLAFIGHVGTPIGAPLPPGWTPLALLIQARQQNVGVIMNAATPVFETGIVPPTGPGPVIGPPVL